MKLAKGIQRFPPGKKESFSFSIKEGEIARNDKGVHMRVVGIGIIHHHP